MGPETVPDRATPDEVAAVRRFNRFHTRFVVALNKRLLASPYSPAQIRLLCEVAHDQPVSAATVAHQLGLDPGYLSRTVSGLEAQGLLSRTASEDDARRLDLSLTDAGKAALAELDAASAQEVADLLKWLTPENRRQVVGAMRRIERLLGEAPSPEPFILRDPEPGDLGWITHRHGVIYAREYGWDWTFEALVASIVADFAKGYDPAHERCWVAEREGEVVGSVFVVRADDETAKLRLLYVEPTARGLGIGRRLVEGCLRFARTRGYRRMILRTNSVLISARRIYEGAGFRLTAEEPHRSFGQDLIGQTWERDL